MVGTLPMEGEEKATWGDIYLLHSLFYMFRHQLSSLYCFHSSRHVSSHLFVKNRFLPTSLPVKDKLESNE